MKTYKPPTHFEKKNTTHMSPWQTEHLTSMNDQSAMNSQEECTKATLGKDLLCQWSKMTANVGGYTRGPKCRAGAGTGKEPETALAIQGVWHDPMTRKRQTFLQVVLEKSYEKWSWTPTYTIYKTGTGKGWIYIKLLEENKASSSVTSG